MFIDVCFPSNNEMDFIDVAKKLGTRGLLFVYNRKYERVEANEFRVLQGSTIKGKILLTNNLTLNQKNLIYYYSPAFPEKKTFNAAVKGITQVTMNSIHEREGILGISFSHLLKSKCFEEVSFIIRLAKKSKTNLFFASFAESPLELRESQTLESVFKVLSRDTSLSRTCKENLDRFIQGCS